MVKGGITKEVFFSFIRCNKLAQYNHKFTYLSDEKTDTNFQNANEIQFKNFATKLICGSEKDTCSKIYINKEFKTRDGETVSADIILKRKANEALKFKKETILIEIVNSSNQLDGMEFTWLAYKRFLISKTDYQIDKIYVIKVDKAYQKNAEINENFLFVKDVTFKIQQYIPNIPPIINRIKKNLAENALMDKQKGTFCLEPNPCPFRKHCWNDQHLESETAFEIEDMPAISKFRLYWDETFLFENIPRKRLNKRQLIQVKYGIQNLPAIDKSKIAEWISKLNLNEGAWYLHVNSIYPVVPFSDSATPYSNTPFQFSLKYQFPGGTNFTAYDFIASDTEPSQLSLSFITNLLRIINFNQQAKIIIYDARKIEKCFNNLAKWHPEYASGIKEIKARFVDLMEVFYECWYYLPSFKGKYSIQKIVPIMLKDKEYAILCDQNSKNIGNIFLDSIYSSSNISLNNKMLLHDFSDKNSTALMELVTLLTRV